MADKLKIILVGDAPLYQTTLKKLGHLPLLFPVSQFYAPSILNRLVNEALQFVGPTPDFWGAGRMGKILEKEFAAFQPHLAIFFDPIYFSPVTLQKLQEKHAIPFFSFFSDDAFVQKNASRFFYESIPLYDLHFTTRPENVSDFLQNKARRAIALPMAFFPIEKAVNPPRESTVDVGFFGNHSSVTKDKYLARLGREISSLGVYPKYEELSQWAPAAKIAAVFSPKGGAEDSSDYMLGVPGCGTFLLHERNEEVKEIFREGIEAEFFSEYTEFRDKIAFYLKNPSARQDIAKKGYDRVHRPDLSLEHRVQAMLWEYRQLISSPHWRRTA